MNKVQTVWVVFLSILVIMGLVYFVAIVSEVTFLEALWNYIIAIGVILLLFIFGIGACVIYDKLGDK